MYGNVFVFALDKDGKVYSWGGNEDGQLGDGTFYNRGPAFCISDIEESDLKNKKIKSIIIESDSVYALDEDGKLYVWGDNRYGSLGDGTTNDRTLPKCISDIDGSELKGKSIVEIAGDFSVLALDEDGKLYAWGKNDHGQLGDGTTNSRLLPKCISNIEASELNGKNITQIVYTGSGVEVVDDRGKRYIWGCNEFEFILEQDILYIPICINDVISRVLNNKEIKWFNSEYVIDKDGKIYCEVSNDEQLEDGSNFRCLSDDEDNILYNKKVKKVNEAGLDVYLCTLYISEDNEIYYYLGDYIIN